MIIVPAPPPKRRGFATTWLPWLILGAIVLVFLIPILGSMDNERAAAPPEALDFYAKVIQAHRLNCPKAQRIYPQGDDAYGRVVRVSCDNGVDFRFTWLAGERGFRAEPWR